MEEMEEFEEPVQEKVICEVPVYLTKALAEKLYLMQYPQRPVTVPLDHSEILETRVKPELGKLQVVLGINPDGEYYDEFHGETLAEAAEGLGFDQNQYIPDAKRRIDRAVLESSNNPTITNASRYVVGIIKEGAVHISPLESIVQMKTTLPFLNKADKAKAKFEGASADTEDETEEEATKVTVKFKRTKDPNKVGAYKSSFVARKKEEEEPWVPLKYQSKDEAVHIRSRMSVPSDNDTPMYILTQEDYLAKLFPKYKEAVIDGSDKQTKVNVGQGHQRIHSQNMRGMALADQLKILILNGKVMRYDQIVEFLKIRLRIQPMPDDTTLLRNVQTVAVLVQGCWVAKSQLVYPDEIKSNANGVPASIMQAARDSVLNLFNEVRILERKKLAPTLHIPNEELTEILSNIAKRVIKKGWEFFLPYDDSFVEKFPDIVQRQNKMWEMKNQHKSRKISETSLKPPASRSPRRRHSRTMSCSSDNDSGTEAEHRSRTLSGGGGGRQRRPSSRSSSESSSLAALPSRVES